MKIQLLVNGKALDATLNDSAASRDFMSLLPLTLTLTDYASNEKIADLPKKLSLQGAPAGIDPEVGDITYYAPWGNLAIFYRDFGYAKGLVSLGRINADMSLFAGKSAMQVTMRRTE
ncbi:cyclophilin-like fold protein [Pokkaliibacter sp. MBI-7]|uniref:cyclophilin-like fold protein n=1 Tax=Pokkaliibacter sp. MBI-7 TaxID=3040600 RepID=UPI00244D3566|nr:cyclophilin-like fold protein [Pokkaliibacter sp. MBI-7]MDH2431391.1 cyclophilin-like fold protein [Pokkaliibacter sp. MBI-7]